MNKLVDSIDATIDSMLPQTPEAIARRKKHLLIPLAAIAMTSVLAGGGIAIHNLGAEPHFSKATTSYEVTGNDGLESVVGHIEGIDSIRVDQAENYVSQLEQNKALLKDGLQPGEWVTIPRSVEQ